MGVAVDAGVDVDIDAVVDMGVGFGATVSNPEQPEITRRTVNVIKPNRMCILLIFHSLTKTGIGIEEVSLIT